MSDPGKDVDPQSIEESIHMLKRYVDEEEIKPLISVLEALAENPHDKALVEQLSNVFGGLGIRQGAALTYAPCIAIILSDDIFKETE